MTKILTKIKVSALSYIKHLLYSSVLWKTFSVKLVRHVHIAGIYCASCTEFSLLISLVLGVWHENYESRKQDIFPGWIQICHIWQSLSKACILLLGFPVNNHSNKNESNKMSEEKRFQVEANAGEEVTDASVTHWSSLAFTSSALKTHTNSHQRYQDNAEIIDSVAGSDFITWNLLRLI